MDSSAPRTGEADRGRGAPRRSGGTPAAIPAIAILLLGALALRLIIAYVLFPGSGFKNDVGTFTSWALTLAHSGPGGFYANAGFADYPPGYLYVLWLIGSLGNGLAGLLGGGTITVAGTTMALSEVITGALLKLPAIASDLLIGYLLYRVVRRWMGARREAMGAALGAAALFLFNPVTWYDSALWGQVDSVGTLVMLVAVVLLVDGFSEGAVAAAVLAALIKPQFGVVLAPLLVVLLLRRHVFAIGSGPRATLVPRVLRGWLTDEQGPWRLVSCAVVGVSVLLLLIVPFSLDVPSLIGRLQDTAGTYPYLTVNAYNPWALVGAGGLPSMAASGGWSPDQVPLIGSLSGVTVGALLLGAAYLVAILQLALRDSRRSILLTVVFLSLAFFILPTRVHERYLFPVFAFLPLLAVGSRSFKIATLALAAASFVNLHAVLTNPLYGTANVVGLPVGEEFRTFWWVALSVVTQTTVFVYLLWRLRPSVDLVGGPLRRLFGLPPRAPDPDPYDAPAPPPRRAALDGGTPARAEPSSAGSGLEPAADAPTAMSRLRLLRLPSWLGRRSLRADRSASVQRELPGRPDRLDLLVALLLIVAALTLRTWRLEEPYGMHFDEVYHARTATEFLQDWRYGEPHSIYEFTHPHLAKYLIAAGIVLFGDNQVTGQASLAGPVNDVLVEQRWSPSDRPAERDGDRFYVATAGGVGAYDLQTRQEVALIAVPDAARMAQRLALDADAHRLYISDAEGGAWTFDTQQLDLVRHPPQATPGSGTDLGPGPTIATKLGDLGTAALDLAVSQDGGTLVAVVPAGKLVSLSTDDGHRTGEAADPGATALEAVNRSDAAGQVAVADQVGITLRDPVKLDKLDSATLPAPATGLTLMTGLDQPPLYVTTAAGLSWVALPNSGPPTVGGPLQMPGAVRDVAWDDATNLVHVLGRTPDGSADTVYVVEPHANAVFADAPLPFTTAAWALDTQRDRPSQDREQLLALDSSGSLAVVDIGQNAFGWRFMGVIAGALMAGLIYLMSRFLFRRRSAGLFAAALILVDGMFFAQSRIAMNDTYVAFFIVAAYALFTPLYLGVWRGRAAALLGIPTVGLLLGLALASKWVGAYAIGGIVLLLLLRSALGRFIALGAMIGLTGVLGWVAIGASSPNAPLGDLTFVVIMVALTALLAAAIVLRPIRWTVDEVRFAVGAPAALGALIGLGAIVFGGRLSAEGPLTVRNLFVVAAGLLGLALAIYALFTLAGRRGLGPLAGAAGGSSAGLEPPSEPPRQAWLLPGLGWGVPWLLALGCLTVLPLVVYVVSYTPWVALGNQFWPGMPPGSNGQTLWDLTLSMYNYHNDLRAAHAASSPWWAWPFDLKPVWFFQQGFADGTTGIIYDAGNLVLFWISVPVLAWTAYQAWARRSLALTLVMIGFLCQWLPWSRIDRATFQYHYFTALPFLVLGVAYFLAELWHGPSARTWLLARAAAAAALVGVPLMWLLRAPLCWAAGVAKVAPSSQVCGYVSLPFVLTERIAAVALILAVGGGIFLWQLRILLREGRLDLARGRPAAGPPGGTLWLGVTAAATLVALILAVGRFGETPLLSVPLGSAGPYLFALLTLVPLAAVAYFVLLARDPRRFALGLVGAMTIWFVIFYPDISGLPIPTGLKNLFQVLPLPTYSYDFQFAVNTDPATVVHLGSVETLSLTLVTAALAGAVMYAAWSWRQARAEAVARPPDPARPSSGPRGLDAPAG
ncbi:MAG: phospholipid carrier-dependent glycosyltransferase [Candidatus Limnocylindrales bacterium]